MTTTRKNTGSNASNAPDSGTPATAQQGNGNGGGNTGGTTGHSGGGKGPTHIAYQVREGREKGKSYWTRIGAAWPHNDGEGFNIQLECVPLDGRVTLRVASEAKE